MQAYLSSVDLDSIRVLRAGSYCFQGVGDHEPGGPFPVAVGGVAVVVVARRVVELEPCAALALSLIHI